MSKVNFVYNGNETSILCKETDNLKEIFNKFTNKEKILGKKMFYLYNGNKISDENKTVEQLTKEKSFTILAFDAENKATNTNKITQSSDVICPECKCNAFLTIKDYKLNLTCGQNMHSFNNILIKDFLKTQEIDNDKIICKKCNINKSSIYNSIFYRCCTCKEDICPTCKINHDNNHKIINYDERNYICNIHNEIFICYCKTCKKNICMLCESDHDNHEIVNFGKILIKDDDIIKEMKEIRKEFDELENKINENIERYNNIKINIEEYYNIINGIINNYIKSKKRNYEILKNIRELIDNNIINDIKKINIDNKYDDIINIYNKINKKEEFKISQSIEEKLMKKVKINKPLDKCKNIYQFYKEFISKMFNLKDNKISISSNIIDINQFDYISTFIVFQSDFQKYEKKLLFKEMEILSKIKDKEHYDYYEKKLDSDFNFKSVSINVKEYFYKNCKNKINDYSNFCFVCKDLLLKINNDKDFSEFLEEEYNFLFFINNNKYFVYNPHFQKLYNIIFQDNNKIEFKLSEYQFNLEHKNNIKNEPRILEEDLYKSGKKISYENIYSKDKINININKNKGKLNNNSVKLYFIYNDKKYLLSVDRELKNDFLFINELTKKYNFIPRNILLFIETEDRLLYLEEYLKYNKLKDEDNIIVIDNY